MDAAVLWIYQEVKAHGVPLEAGQKPALCLRGRKYMLCVIAAHPVRVLKRSVKDFDKARRVVRNGADYPVERAIEQFTEIAERNGITEKARKLLQKARESTEVNEEEFTDEEDIESTGPNSEESSARPRRTLSTADSGTGEKTEKASRTNLLASICEELKIEGAVARRKLRKAGLHAPYDNEAAIREVLK